MARQTNRLTTRAVAAANEPGLYSDGGGLNLAVARGGSKSWIYRYMLRRRSRDMGLGGVDVVSLAEAREKALEARKLVKAGVESTPSTPATLRERDRRWTRPRRGASENAPRSTSKAMRGAGAMQSTAGSGGTR